MNIIEAARSWLRSSRLIDHENKFNAGYLGERAYEYSLTASAETHRQDILGNDLCTCSLVFMARLPYGDAIRDNLSAADFFAGLSAWILQQNRSHSYPAVSGYAVTNVSASNAGMIMQADSNTARYQIQIQIDLEEVS